MADVVKLAWYVYLKKLKNDPVRTKVNRSGPNTLNRRRGPPNVTVQNFSDPSVPLSRPRRP